MKFNKLLPKNLGQKEQIEKDRNARMALGPPVFRTVFHQLRERTDPKRPPDFETGVRESSMRPGLQIDASDRTYFVERDGSIRRPSRKSRPQKGRKPTREQVAAENRATDRISREIEAEEQTRRRRRATRQLRKSQETRDRATTLQRAAAARRGQP